MNQNPGGDQELSKNVFEDKTESNKDHSKLTDNEFLEKKTSSKKQPQNSLGNKTDNVRESDDNFELEHDTALKLLDSVSPLSYNTEKNDSENKSSQNDESKQQTFKYLENFSVASYVDKIERELTPNNDETVSDVSNENEATIFKVLDTSSPFKEDSKELDNINKLVPDDKTLTESYFHVVTEPNTKSEESAVPLTHNTDEHISKEKSNNELKETNSLSELECVLEPSSINRAPDVNSNGSTDYSVTSFHQVPQMEVKNVDYKTMKPESELRLPFRPKKVEFVRIQSSLFNDIDNTVYEHNIQMLNEIRSDEHNIQILEELRPDCQSSSKSLKQSDMKIYSDPNINNISSNVNVIKSISNISECMNSSNQSLPKAGEAPSKFQGRIAFATGDLYFEELQSRDISKSEESINSDSKTDITTVANVNKESIDSKKNTSLDHNKETIQESINLVNDQQQSNSDKTAPNNPPLMCDEGTQTDRQNGEQEHSRKLPSLFIQDTKNDEMTMSQTINKLSPSLKHPSKEQIGPRRKVGIFLNSSTEIPIIDPDSRPSSIIGQQIDHPGSQSSLESLKPPIEGQNQPGGILKNAPPTTPRIAPDLSWKETVKSISESTIKRQKSQQTAAEPKKVITPTPDQESCFKSLLMGCYSCLFCDKCFGPLGGDARHNSSAADFGTPSRDNCRRLSQVSAISDKTVGSYMMSSVESLPK